MMPHRIRRIGIVAAIMVFAAAVGHACIFTYTLVGPDGSVEIRSGTPAHVVTGESYRIEIAMRENHANCRIQPEDTLFLLEEGRWRLLRDTQPLVLLEEIVWEQTGSRRYATVVSFSVAQAGAWRVDVIRECDRGGYHETLILETFREAGA